jgi:Ca2+-binding RTX toxin-like protein
LARVFGRFFQEHVMSRWTVDPAYVSGGLFFPGNFSDFYEGNLSIHTATRMRFRVNGDAYSTYDGRGITYVNGPSGPTDVTGGTITGFVFTRLGLDRAWVIEDLNLSAATFFDLVQAEDPTAFKVFLLSGADEIVGSRQGDIIWGYARGDTLLGRGGNDDLMGMTGNDTLSGGVGKDTLSGGAGQDVFLFTTQPNGALNLDSFADFDAAQDQIRLDRDAFAGIGAVGALGAARFRAGTAATDASDRILYDQTSGSLWFDRDGKGGAAKVLFADLGDGTVVTAADFQIIA